MITIVICKIFIVYKKITLGLQRNFLNPKVKQMKKLFAILAVAATLSACNDTETKSSSESDSLAAAATRDSLAAIQAMPDTTMKIADTSMMKIDSTKK